MVTVTFPLQFENEVSIVSKIEKATFTSLHHDILDSLQYADGQLNFADERWKSIYLGAGEEKAVYCICDHEQHVFALEVINENSYLNGRLIDGEYFFDKRIRGLTNIQPNPDALFRYV